MTMDKVREFLESIGLGQYVQTFEDQGWDDIDIVRSMSETDIKTCIQKPGHVKKVLLRLENIRKENSVCGDSQETDSAFSEQDLSKVYDLTSRGCKRSLSDDADCSENVGKYVKNEACSGELSTVSQDTTCFTFGNDNLGQVKCENKEADVTQTITCSDFRVTSIEKYAPGDEETECISTQSRPSWAVHGREESSRSIVTAQTGHKPAPITIQARVSDSKYVTIAENVIQNISKEKTNGNNFKAQIETYLNRIEEKHNGLFVSTSAVGEIDYVLEDRNWVVILGNPGEGKSMISDHLLLEYRKQNYEPLILTSADDWKSLVTGGRDSSKKQFVKIDDIFGTMSLDERKYLDWSSLFDMIDELVKGRKGYLKVVCTSRKLIYSEIEVKLKNVKCFEKMRIIDLSSEYTVSKDEKKDIIKKYISHYGIDLDENQIRAVLECKISHGFPHCVEMFCTIQVLRELGIIFFYHPLEMLEKEIKVLQMSEKNKFSALVLVLIASIQENEVRLYGDGERCSKLLDITKKLTNMPTLTMGDIFNDIRIMKNVYLEINEDDVVRFKHHSFYELVSLILAETNPVTAVKYLDLNFIIYRTKFSEYKKSLSENIVILPHSCKKHLVDRFTKDIRNQKGIVFKHQAWGNEAFVQLWLKYVTSDECEVSLEHIVQIEFKYVSLPFSNGTDSLLSLLTTNSQEKAALAILLNEHLKTHWQSLEGSHQLSVALLRASEAGCSSNLLKNYLEFGADIDYNNHYHVGFPFLMIKERITALCVAICRGNVEHLLLLLNNGASLIAHDKSIIIIAYRCRNPVILRHVLNAINNIGRQSIIYTNGHLHKQKYLYGEDYSDFFFTFLKSEAALSILPNNEDRVLQLLNMRQEISDALLNVVVNSGYFSDNIFYKLESCNVEFQKIWELVIPFFSKNHVSIKALDMFIKRGFKLNMTDREGKTILHHIVSLKADKQNAEEMTTDTKAQKPYQHVSLTYLLNLGADVNVKDNTGAIPVFYGIQENKWEIPELEFTLESLIEISDVDKVSDLCGRNCFHYLAMSKNRHNSEIQKRIIGYLLRKKSDINQIDKMESVPLAYCSPEMIKQFIQMGADPKVLDCDKKNLIMKMIENNEFELLGKISILIEANIDIAMSDATGRNVLHYVADSAYCDADKKQLFGTFIDKGANMNKKDCNGMTPLMLVVSNKSSTQRIASFCVNHRFSVVDKDDCHMSVLDHCIQGNMSKDEKIAVLKHLFQVTSDVSDKSLVYAFRQNNFCEQIICCILKNTYLKLDHIYHILYDMFYSGDCFEVSSLTTILYEKFGKRVIDLLLGDKRMRMHVLVSLDQKLISECRESIKEIFSDGVCLLETETDIFVRIILQNLLYAGFKPDMILHNEENDIPELALAKRWYLLSLNYLLMNKNPHMVILKEKEMKQLLESLAACPESYDMMCFGVLEKLFKATTNLEVYSKIKYRQLKLWCKQRSLKPVSIILLISTGKTDVIEEKTESLTHSLIKRLEGGIEDPCFSTIVFNIKWLLQELSENNFDTCVSDEKGKTPLMILLFYMWVCNDTFTIVPSVIEEVVELLISLSKKIDQYDHSGRNILHYIAQCNLKDNSKRHFCEIVMKKDVRFVRDCFGKSPIDYLLDIPSKYGLFSEYIKTLQYLLEYEHDMKHITKLLIFSIPSVSLDPLKEDLFIKVLLSTDGNPVVDTDVTGSTFLAQSARFFSRKLVLHFLKNGVEPNKADIMSYTVLHRVVFSPVLSRLALYKCAFFGQNIESEMRFQSRSSFPWEIELCERDITNNKWKLHGFALDQINDWKLHYHIIEKINDGLFILHQLLEHGADPNMMDINGKTPLHYCAESPVFDGFTCPAMQLLLAYGADVNSEDFEGRTPIMLCAQTERTKFRRMNILINAGANLFTKDYTGNNIHDFVRLCIQKKMSSNLEERCPSD